MRPFSPTFCWPEAPILDSPANKAFLTSMALSGYKAFTLEERPDLLEAVLEVCAKAWPDFMVQDPIVNRYWSSLYKVYPQFQFALVVDKSDNVLGVGNSVPIVWEGDFADLPDQGVDWVLEQEFRGLPAEHPVKTEVALQIVVPEAFRGNGISGQVIRKMMDIGRIHGLKNLVAPVRPTQKSTYPLTAMEQYVRWKNQEGLPFDAWMRVHARLGAKIVKVCAKSLHISGTVSDWESWTKMFFPQSGSYVVPGALVPVEINCAANQGVYVEPNVWMHHAIE